MLRAWVVLQPTASMPRFISVSCLYSSRVVREARGACNAVSGLSSKRSRRPAQAMLAGKLNCSDLVLAYMQASPRMFWEYLVERLSRALRVVAPQACVWALRDCAPSAEQLC